MIKMETHKGVKLITLDRPEALNAFSAGLFDALIKALRSAVEDESVRVVVLTGNGRAFSAGADLTEMAAAAKDVGNGYIDLVTALIDFPKPLIVAVNGLGVGIGATICGLADITFMAESARLRCPFSALGLTAEAASTYTFPQIMGPQAAAWLLLAAEWMSAAQCKEAGLALEVFPDASFLDEVLKRAHALAVLPVSSLIQTKTLMRAPHRKQMKAAALAEDKALAHMLGQPANQEALRAFSEKRTPDSTKIR